MKLCSIATVLSRILVFFTILKNVNPGGVNVESVSYINADSFSRSNSSIFFSSNSIPSSPISGNPVVDFCVRRLDIFDGLIYQGSACFVNLTRTWQEAMNYCESKGMFFYRIVNTLLQLTLFQAAESVYGQFSNQSVWINTKKNATGSWISYENTNQTILREFARLTWVDRNAQTAGDCMAITNRQGPFRVTGANCSEAYPFVCSFRNPVFNG